MSALKNFCLILAFSLVLTSCARVPVVNWFVTDHNVVWKDTRWCVPTRLKLTIRAVARKYGKVIVTSTKRGRRENRRKGGASNSWHLKCKAVDFIVRSKASKSEIKRYLRKRHAVGGLSYYRRTGHFHIDVGPKRTW